MEFLAKARSFKRGTLSADDIRAIGLALRHPSLPELVGDVASELGNYAGDALVHDGDLEVEGHFNVPHSGVALLFVNGDLIVDGTYSDADDPQTIVAVKGSMSAKAIVTAGFLEVQGSVRVAGAFVGDYNDCDAWIGGDVECALFYPEEHFFTIGGELRFEHAVGNTKHRVRASKPVIGVDLDDRRLLELFDRELLRVHQDGDEVDVDGFDFRAVKQRLLEGRPLRTR